jgi:hypothetical protein
MSSRTPKTPNPKKKKVEDVEKKPKKEPKTHLHFRLKETEDVRIVPLMNTLESYYDLQIEIARYLPRFKQLTIVRDQEKEIITSRNFHASPVYYISEVHTDSMPAYLPVEKLKWDFTDYHGKPTAWVDTFELKKVEDEERKAAEAAEEEADDDDLFGMS